MRSIEITSGIILRSAFVLIAPLIFASSFIYQPFFFREYFTPGGSSEPLSGDLITDSILTRDISNYLDEKTNFIQSLSPILPLSDKWFKFDVSIKNDLKVALVVTEQKSYTEATTTLSVQTQFGSTIIPYGQETTIAVEKGSDDLNNLITAFAFLANKSILVGPNEIVLLQTNPDLGRVSVTVMLAQKYRWLIYFECLIVFIGIFILAKEALKFIKLGFKYFMEGSN